MQHNISVTGYAFRLRPITIDDASSIIQLRAEQPEKTQYLHPVSTDLAVQRKYLLEYFERPNDYYFVLERLKNNAAEGLIGIYDMTHHPKSAEWGRWILSGKSLGATECCWLIYQVAFDHLDLDLIHSRTVTANHAVVSFHESCGLERGQVLPAHYELNDRVYDAVDHVLSRDRWLEIGQELSRKSQRIASRLN
jgi:RimJ/RimL family protein N-acetyltransferase